jgi:hypothetical protein
MYEGVKRTLQSKLLYYSNLLILFQIKFTLHTIGKYYICIGIVLLTYNYRYGRIPATWRDIAPPFC